MLKNLFIIIIFLGGILMFLRIGFVKKNLITPIGNLVYNFQKGNFSEKECLQELGIDLNVKKHIWTYDINKKSDRIIIYFTAPLSHNEENKYVQADMHILIDSYDNQTFQKLVEANIGFCATQKLEIKKKNGYEMNQTLCINDTNTLAHFDIPEKNIMITIHPYHSQSEKIILELIHGIKLLEH